jgi:hypothetical protein
MQTNAVLMTATASSCAGAPAGVHFTADLSFVGGSSAATMYDDGTHGDAVAGDGTFSLSYTVPDSLLPAPPPGPGINRPYIVPMTATDSLGRNGHAYAAFYVTAAPTGTCCVGAQTSVRTQASCAAAGGTYQGNGTSPYRAPGTVYTGTGIPINDNQSNSGSITISDTTTINDMVVHLNGYHSWLGDLTCTLSNGVTTVKLFDRVGRQGLRLSGARGLLRPQRRGQRPQFLRALHRPIGAGHLDAHDDRLRSEQYRIPVLVVD